MKPARLLWPVLLLAAICICQSPRQTITSARIKVENDGTIVAGIHPTTTPALYDPYFIHVNDTPHLQ